MTTRPGGRIGLAKGKASGADSVGRGSGVCVGVGGDCVGVEVFSGGITVGVFVGSSVAVMPCVGEAVGESSEVGGESAMELQPAKNKAVRINKRWI